MRRRELLEAARVFRAGGAGATWEVTQEVTSREKLESVNKTGDRGWGGCIHKAGGRKEECSGSTRVVCDEGSGQEQAELGGQRLVRLQGDLECHTGLLRLQVGTTRGLEGSETQTQL